MGLNNSNRRENAALHGGRASCVRVIWVAEGDGVVVIKAFKALVINGAFATAVAAAGAALSRNRSSRSAKAGPERG